MAKVVLRNLFTSSRCSSSFIASKIRRLPSILSVHSVDRLDSLAVDVLVTKDVYVCVFLCGQLGKPTGVPWFCLELEVCNWVDRASGLLYAVTGAKLTVDGQYKSIQVVGWVFLKPQCCLPITLPFLFLHNNTDL